jgi:hypothetical protein
VVSQPDRQADERPWPSRTQVAAGAWASLSLGSNGDGCWPKWAARSSWSWWLLSYHPVLRTARDNPSLLDSPRPRIPLAE